MVLASMIRNLYVPYRCVTEESSAKIVDIVTDIGDVEAEQTLPGTKVSE